MKMQNTYSRFCKHHLSVPFGVKLKYFLFICALLFNFHYVRCQLINQPPYFEPGSGDMARFSLSENTPVGSPVYQLKGIDPEGSRLKYSISGPVFSVDRETGVVRLRQQLDRETQDIIEVIISITDDGIYGTEPNTVSRRREIPVRDYNDNHPTFIGRPYTSNARESLPVGAELDIQPPIIVIDRDYGINAQVEIKCFQENDICETFDVQAIVLSEGNYTAKVTLRKPLDYESRPSYIMTVVASDSAVENRLSSFASVSINVIDVQDQLPVFTNAPYSATVEENTPPGASVLTIKAMDGDVGIPRDIVLSLENEIFGHFELAPISDDKDGTAILKTTDVPIDRENSEILQNGGVYVFNVRATELDDDGFPAESATTSVTIVVTDVDDHIPEFNAEYFNVSIPENLENGMPLPGLSVFVDDIDMAENSRYELSLIDVTNSDGIFAVTPSEAQGRTPVVVKVLNSTHLDYDVQDPNMRKFEFDLVAMASNDKLAVARVEVHLLDVNDNSPIFEFDSYQFQALENFTANTKIGLLKATDKDSGNFGRVTYLLKGFGSDNFRIDSTSGEFFIQKPLDYEVQSSYSLSAVAVDGGGRETNANIHVVVIDVNDNSPTFENDEYSRIIREGAMNFEPQLFIRAHDVDGPTQGGGKVKYSIVSENSIAGNVFSIDEHTGEITLQRIARSMDTERGEYELVVSATDFGDPPLTNTTRVLIRVGISGNQRPIFKGHFQSIENVPVLGPPSYRVSIPENAPPGYNVTTVNAHDPDGLDSLLRYRIVGANDNFEIDEISGVITVSPLAHIDRDANMDSFEITVNAVDSGSPIPETATTTVYVNVKDINDEKPHFEQVSYASFGRISERTEIGERVLQVKAIDADLNSKLQYKIKGSLKATSKAGISIDGRSNYKLQEAFRIDSVTGEIFVNGTLRHDVAAVISFTVEVRDLNAEVDPEGQTDIAEVIIYVQSFKDTNPIFLNPGWKSSKRVVNIHIKEEMPIGSALFILQAEDPVANLPITKFDLVDPKELEYFQIGERTGEVILKKRLDYEELEANETRIEFWIRATSPDGERNTITMVNVTIENVNDNSPIFEENAYHATVVENSIHPQKVTRVKATDKDASLTQRDEIMGYNKIIYTLHGENAELFHINKTTGEIVLALNQSIDRERTPRLNLQVKAEDSPRHPSDAKQSIVVLTIDVLDINDNVPQFDQKKYTSVVPENAPVDTFVLKIHASDLDDGPGGEVRYRLLNEGEATGLFKVHPVTGDIKVKRELTGKGRAEPYILVVQAEDNGNQVSKQESLSSDVDVIIHIGDVSANDGVPNIISPAIGQMANVSENAPIGTTVFQVIANDPDDPSTPSGTLFYNILEDTFDAKFFTIDPNTGLITTLSVLDRETKDIHHIILEVYDNGEPRQSVTRILQIVVLDVDDHEPRFVREVDTGPLEFSVQEEEASDTMVGVFTAIDEDIDENAAIDYVITDGNNDDIFKIERTETNGAILKTTKPIDREKIDEFIITVKCLKKGEPNYKFIGDSYDRYDLSLMRISIKIIDIDDNFPIFAQKDASIGIRTNVPIDTVVTNVQATDRDAEAAPIQLAIDSIKFVPQYLASSAIDEKPTVNNLFKLNKKTGELRTATSFADYVDGHFQIRIRANNSAKVTRHSFNNLKVFVIRDKSLLKFVFARPPRETQNNIETFQKKVQQKIKPLGLELHILDTQVLMRPDMSLDFTSTSSCFQMFKNASAIPLPEMQKLMNSEKMKQDLLDIYAEYGVSQVDLCSVQTFQLAAFLMAHARLWLIILAAVIAIAAIIAVISACCLRRKYKLSSKRSLQSSRTLSDPYIVGMGVPTVYYTEPIYGHL